ncbi:hypothetical protein LINPERPRIM_LOCUS18041 [Linum perenne]
MESERRSVGGGGDVLGSNQRRSDQLFLRC